MFDLSNPRPLFTFPVKVSVDCDDALIEVLFDLGVNIVFDDYSGCGDFVSVVPKPLLERYDCKGFEEVEEVGGSHVEVIANVVRELEKRIREARSMSREKTEIVDDDAFTVFEYPKKKKKEEEPASDRHSKRLCQRGETHETCVYWYDCMKIKEAREAAEAAKEGNTP